MRSARRRLPSCFADRARIGSRWRTLPLQLSPARPRTTGQGGQR